MQEKKPRKSNSKRTEEMRALLIGTARVLFVEKGFAETGTPEIVKQANVTRGALYHHFADKTDLFRAVVREEADALGRDITAAASEARTPEGSMRQGTLAFFQAMRASGRARLLLIEGPGVLGVAEMDRIDAGGGRAALAAGLAALLPDEPEDRIRAYAETLSAAFDRAALAVAEGGDATTYTDVLLRLVEGVTSS